MPKEEDLPETLARLASIKGFELRPENEHFEKDVDELIEKLDHQKQRKTLDELLTMLRRTDVRLLITGQGTDQALCLEADNGEQLKISTSFEGSVGRLESAASPKRREEIYLARFALKQLYTQWDRLYLPLKGLLKPPPDIPMTARLKDRNDSDIGAGGLPLSDIRLALTQHHKTRLVLLGDPGAGKTTTLDRLALDMARQRLCDPSAKLPVRVDLSHHNDSRSPAEFLSSAWASLGLAEGYAESVRQGKVCFLLDGLNQMDTQGRARRVENWKNWASELLEGNWAVFTCRADDYVGSMRLNLPEVHIDTLGKEKIKEYFGLRFGENAQERWDEFESHLRSSEKNFEDLASNPFTLSLLTDACEAGHGLEQNRAELIRHLVERRIEHELSAGRQPDTLTENPQKTIGAIIALLESIGYAMQRLGKGTLELAAIQKLNRRAKKPNLLSAEYLELAKDAHILVGQTDRETKVFKFFHQLIQEYFAACRLLQRFKHKKHFGRFVRVRWQNWQYFPKWLVKDAEWGRPFSPAWAETVQMAASLAGQDTARFIQVVRRHNLPLAGRCLAECGSSRDDLQPLAEDLRQALARRQTHPMAHPLARLDAGLALGEVGHPELVAKAYPFEGSTVWAVWPPLQPVPAGQFLLGSSPEEAKYSDELTAERKQHLAAYEISRYPVTNLEYRFFRLDDGYENQRWWSAEGWQWRSGGIETHQAARQDWMSVWRAWKENVDEYSKNPRFTRPTINSWKRRIQLSEEEAWQLSGQLFDRPFDRPAFWNDLNFASPARPVVGVNWFEAEAYCNWLSAITGKSFCLPNELQWEKAARGPDGRRYPWGDQFQSKRCNTYESHYRVTTPVGMYPAGASPYGIQDASGNVWEWTSSWYQAYPGSDLNASSDYGQKYRVVRGGSWRVTQMGARCAFRGGYTPDYFVNDIGFRVCSPG